MVEASQAGYVLLLIVNVVEKRAAYELLGLSLPFFVGFSGKQATLAEECLATEAA